MTSRKSSLSLAKPIEMPDVKSIDRDSHKIDIMFIPSNEQCAAGNDEISENDVELRPASDKDENIKTVL